jgi:long-chain acyl-CoA synthetase
MITYFIDIMRSSPQHEAVVSSSLSITYQQLLDKIAYFENWLQEHQVPKGAVVSFDGDYSASAIALFLALANNHNIVVPLSTDSKAHFDEFRDIAQTEYDIALGTDNTVLHKTGRVANHQHYDMLKQEDAPGLVLFSSGSTGKSKGIVQNLSKLMSKFTVPRKALRMLIFLQLDHIGGVNSLLYALANKGTVIVARDRSPTKVCEAIEQFKAQVLPTSPTFLNLLLMSGVYKQYDLSSLQLITYGTEPMQKSTLERLAEAFPHTTFQQTYGLSEVGILRSKSRDSSSLWVKVGGSEFDVKIVDGTLRIRSQSAMLGYLNAPSPFDEDGFMDTEDLVEQDGEWIRILGRKSEIINVGGAKVFPAEVESILLEMPEVEDVVVYGVPHPMTGKVVTAKIKPSSDFTARELKLKMRQYCADKLASYKIPSKIILTEGTTYNERFKRMRREVK